MKIPKRLLALAIALLLPTVSWAITFQLGNNPQPGEENVLLNNGTTGMLVTGITNQTGFVINFTSTQVLSEPSSGQARIEATNNSSQVALANVSFSLANGGTFDDAIFNMFIGGIVGTGGGNAVITAVANDGNFQFSTTLGNGSNFLTIVATGGEVLESIGIAYSNGFTDLRQPRISEATSTAVPDADATLPLLGASILALALIRPKLAV